MRLRSASGSFCCDLSTKNQAENRKKLLGRGGSRYSKAFTLVQHASKSRETASERPEDKNLLPKDAKVLISVSLDFKEKGKIVVKILRYFPEC